MFTLFCNRCRISYWSEKQLDETDSQGDYSSRSCTMRWTQKVAEDSDTDWGGVPWWTEHDWNSVVAMPMEPSRRITELVSRNYRNNTWDFIYLMQIYYYEPGSMPGNDISTCIHMFSLTRTKTRQSLQSDWDFDMKMSSVTHQ